MNSTEYNRREQIIELEKELALLKLQHENNVLVLNDRRKAQLNTPLTQELLLFNQETMLMMKKKLLEIEIVENRIAQLQLQLK